MFNAFVDAGAISKANADDPKKSSLVRCARTDKGVHAAGNMISLKLIVEDPDIVQKINSHLAPQIRVWGIERTIGSFSCYQACDSRWYEYFLPTHSLLPPHPSSFLAKKIQESAIETNDLEAYESRQEEVKGFWDEVDEKHIKPILESLDDDIRAIVAKALYEPEDVGAQAEHDEAEQPAQKTAAETDNPTTESVKPAGEANGDANSTPAQTTTGLSRKETLQEASKSLKSAYNTAKRAWRIPKTRIERLQEALELYVGVKNYWNYTIQKSFRDPSSKRIIKSFVINPNPIIINGTEWLSLKVHGQSFMMHQIRKMVGMATLLVRCGAPLSRITESYGEDRWSIPKAPSLGLLLERPVFDTYNERQAKKFDRELLDFGKYETELEAFKQKQIYQRIFDEEAKENKLVTPSSSLVLSPSVPLPYQLHLVLPGVLYGGCICMHAFTNLNQ